MSGTSTAVEPQQSQRLHITPFRPDLLNSYLGPALAPLVKNVSYHTVQNFPEVGFGYLELPMAEATKLKKKLNGSILKGHKIRIEDAQPEKRKRSPDEEEGDEEDADKPKKKTRRSKRSKPGDKVLQGYELEDGRKVKRGWTETPAEKRHEKDVKKMKKGQDKDEKAAKKEEKKKAKREASKYTTEPECLFRTTLPAADTSSDKTTEEEKKKARKDKKKRERETIVHEFSNTKKHASFLKSAAVSNGGHATREYVDGKGWVDADGNILEAETTAQKEKRERKERRRAGKVAKAEAEAEAAAEAEAEAEARRLKSSKKDDVVETTKKARSRRSDAAKSTNEVAHSSSEGEASSPEPSSPEPSSSEESSDEESAESEAEPEAALEVDAPKPVHPLEALYKRPLLSPLDTTPKTPKEKNFSFFGGGDDSDIEQDEHTITHNEPQTPFTEQDMEWRVTRSAAPTPDTAAIGKRFSFSVLDDISEDEDDDQANDGGSGDAGAGAIDAINGLGISDAIASGSGKAPNRDEEKEESEFAKWFFENRSENNKKWRARRREAMKMRRKRENRRLTRRIV